MTGKLRLREYVRFTMVCIVMISSVLSVEVDEETLKRLIQEEVERQTGDRHGEAKRLVLDTEEDLFAKVSQLTAAVQVLQTAGVRSTYVRWGRTDCPGNGSDLVYKGYAGGSHYSHTGGGVNYLCLTNGPIYENVENGDQTLSASVYGAEYELDRSNIGGFIGQNLHQDNVPCAVCTTTRSSILMIPGRNACYAGWTLEYKGYLTSGYSGHAAASEFVCLDDHPVPINGGHADQNGKLFYFAEGRCGSLECPPYVEGKELTCAVCSK